MKLTRAVSALLILVMALTLAPGALAAPAPDVSGADDWAKAEVGSLYARGVVPDELMSDYRVKITRAEFTAIMTAVCEYALGTAIKPTYMSPFGDTSASAYHDQIEKAYYMSLINGTSDTTFSPGQPIARQEAAKILYTTLLAIEGGATDSQTVPPYDDYADVSQWARPYVGFAYEYGLMHGTGSSFVPLGSLTRQEAMAIMERLITARGWGEVVPEHAPEPPEQAELPAQEAPTVEPRALVVGVYDYADDTADGERFLNGARDVNSAVSGATLSGIPYTVWAYTNTTYDQLLTALNNAVAGADEDTLTFFFYSGHGVRVTTHYTQNGRDAGSVTDYAISASDGTKDEYLYYTELLDFFSQVPGKKILLFSCCYSGNAVRVAQEQGFDGVVMSAAAADEQSYGFEETYMGVTITYNEFDSIIADGMGVDGIMLADGDKNGALTVGELYAYVVTRMEYSTPTGYGIEENSSLVLMGG